MWFYVWLSMSPRPGHGTMAAAPYLLDQLDPDSVAVAVLRTAFGRSDLPGSHRRVFVGTAPVQPSRSRGSVDDALDRGSLRQLGAVIGFPCVGAHRGTGAASRGDGRPPGPGAGHRRVESAWRRNAAGDLGRRRCGTGLGSDALGRPASAPLADGGPSLLSLVCDDREWPLAARCREDSRGMRLWNLEYVREDRSWGSGQRGRRSGYWRRCRSPVARLCLPVRILAERCGCGAFILTGLTAEAWSEPQHRAQALAAFPRADGRTRLVTVGYDGYLRFWDPVTGREIGVICHGTRRGSSHQCGDGR